MLEMGISIPIIGRRLASRKSRVRASVDAEIGLSLSRHVQLAFCAIFVLFFGFGFIAAVIEIEGAVIASGRVVVESNIKRVQHQEGGIVKEIHVREGQKVDAHDLLVRIDDTLPKTNLKIVQTRLFELWSLEARLSAERDDQTDIDLAEVAVGSLVPEFSIAQQGQRNLLSARRQSQRAQKAQIAEQIDQYDEQIEGLIEQRDAKAKEAALIDQELRRLTGLLDKGLIKRGTVTSLQREKARIEGEHGRFAAEIAQSSQAIAERRVRILQITEDARTEVLEQLQAVRVEISELQEQRLAIRDQLNRAYIRAPQAGIVHQLTVHTVGRVVGPGEDLLAIVPQEDELVIDAQISPTDIDQIFTSQRAIIRMPGLHRGSTPELNANVMKISPDLLQDSITGNSYYNARLILPEEEIRKLSDVNILPGMPVETFVLSEARSILSFLTKPLSDHVSHMFREL